jgi:hypothetical protein
MNVALPAMTESRIVTGPDYAVISFRAVANDLYRAIDIATIC